MTSPRPSLTSLPGHLIREIGLHLYNPLHLTQQDRLTWSIFSTVDMDPPREQGLNDLVNLSLTCSKVRRDLRRIFFRCVRVHGLEKARELIEHRDDWGRDVKSLILDMAMFDPPEAPTPQVTGPSSPAPLPRMELDENVPQAASSSRQEENGRPAQSVAFEASASGGPSHQDDRPVNATSPVYRNPWVESQTLITMLHSLPNLQHLSLFADNSDDITLSLLFSDPHLLKHLAPKMLSFGWRQRAIPPEGFREFSNATMFVSILGWLRHCGQLSFLVLDADMGGMKDVDLFQVMDALAAREEVWRARSQEATRRLGESTESTAATLGKRKRTGSDEEQGRSDKRLVGSSGAPVNALSIQHSLDGRHSLDVHQRCKEAAARERFKVSKISLMICGPIAGWEPSREAREFYGQFEDKSRPPVFLDRLVDRFDGIKELFIDRPIRSREHGEINTKQTLEAALIPLYRLKHLTLLQVGGYALDESMQVNLSQFVAGFCDSLAILGWMGMEGETNWWCAARSKWFADQYPDEYFRARSAKAQSSDSDDLKSRGSDLSDSDDSSQGTSSGNSSQRASSDEYYWDAEQLGVDDIEMRELGDSELAEIYDMVENYDRHLALDAPHRWRAPDRPRRRASGQHRKKSWRILPKQS